MKYTNYFLNKKEYNESICDQVQDSLNYYKETKEFYFFDENENKTESYIIATYNVTSTTSNTRLLSSSFILSQIIEMYVDDVKLDNVVNTYTFNNIGKHEIKFKCDKCIQQITNCDYMFYGCSGLTSIEFSDNFDTSNVTDMSYMFYGCSGLTSLNVSSFNTSKVTSMYAMFQRCYNLTSLDLSNFDTSKVTTMFQMFTTCSGLTSIEFGYYSDVSKVTSSGAIFSNVPSSCTLTLCNNTVNSWNKIISSYTLNTVYIDCIDPSLETNE